MSFGAGVAVTSVLVWRTRYLFLTRLKKKYRVLQVTADLENRRVGFDSGRQQLARAKAGQPARISDGMNTKLGVVGRHLRDIETTKKIDRPGSGH